MHNMSSIIYDPLGLKEMQGRDQPSNGIFTAGSRLAPSKDIEQSYASGFYGLDVVGQIGVERKCVAPEKGCKC